MPLLLLFASCMCVTIKLELRKHITPHANGKPLLKWSSSHSLLQVLQCFYLSGLPMAKLRSKASSKSIYDIPMELCDLILWTNGVRCALNMEYSTRRAFLECTVVELVYKFEEKIYCELFEKVSRSLKYDSNIFFPLTQRVQGNNKFSTWWGSFWYSLMSG